MVELLNLIQIALIDLSLAGDNALVIGIAVASLPAGKRKRALAAGIGAATLLRILMAFFAVRLLHITGLLLAGGFLLFWVAWKMVRDIRGHHTRHLAEIFHVKRMREAIWQIIVADVSMSLDNVLGVAGIARDHMRDLVIGLGLSVALMGFAATGIARLTTRYPKIGYIGVAIIIYTALRMSCDGAADLGWISQPRLALLQ